MRLKIAIESELTQTYIKPFFDFLVTLLSAPVTCGLTSLSPLPQVALLGSRQSVGAYNTHWSHSHGNLGTFPCLSLDSISTLSV